MNIDMKLKSSAQKGFSSILIVVTVLVVGIVGFLIIKSKGSNNTIPTTVISEKNGAGLEKVENKSYTFFYPVSYTSGQLADKEVLYYQNPNSKAAVPEHIFLKVENFGRSFPRPTFESCSKLAESMRQKAEDEIKAEVAYGGFGDGKGIGCKTAMKMPVTGVNDSVMIVEKSLWNETGADSSVYSVRATYFSNASKSETEKLNLAVDQFSLK